MGRVSAPPGKSQVAICSIRNTGTTPSRTNWTLRGQLVLKGGRYGLVSNTLMPNIVRTSSWSDFSGIAYGSFKTITSMLADLRTKISSFYLVLSTLLLLPNKEIVIALA